VREQCEADGVIANKPVCCSFGGHRPHLTARTYL